MLMSYAVAMLEHIGEDLEDSTLQALNFLSYGTIDNGVYTRGIRMSTVLTKKGGAS